MGSIIEQLTKWPKLEATVAIVSAVLVVYMLTKWLKLRVTVASLKKENERLYKEVIELKRLLSSRSQELVDTSIEKENKRLQKEVIELKQLPNDFKLTDGFRQAFDAIEGSDKTVFLTGKAGTGKSTFLNYFRARTQKKVIYLAPTGVAALNIGGKTIHSIFQFPHSVITSDAIKDIKYSEKTRDIFKKIDTIIIDEVSMVRADLLEGINYILQKYRDATKPFGGIQMVFIGDMYQLPPVIDNKAQVDITYKGNLVFRGTLFDYFQRKYGGQYFFNSDAFKKSEVFYLELLDIFRHKDDHAFLIILNSIREKNLTDKLLSDLNSRCTDEEDTPQTNQKRIYLCTTNAVVDAMNDENLNRLKTRLFVYDAEVTGLFSSEFGKKEHNYPAPKALKLKDGAQVMMTKNDGDGRWVNGTLARIQELSDEQIIVEIQGTPFTVNRATWEAIEYHYDQETDELKKTIVGTFSQYPVRLAWAITIHKSQGKTFENVAIDLGNGAFAHGQTYVALSRCTKLEGIILRKPVKRRDIIIDDKVVEFIKTMNRKAKESTFAQNF